MLLRTGILRADSVRGTEAKDTASAFLADGWTYIKVKARWCYLYRAVDKFENTLDFMLSETRDEAAATRFSARTIRNNGWPDRVVIDKNGANAADLENMNLLLRLSC